MKIIHLKNDFSKNGNKNKEKSTNNYFNMRKVPEQTHKLKRLTIVEKNKHNNNEQIIK